VGCLLGLACGDALGAPVEEWSHESIKSSLGTIRDYQATILGTGIITDDTQMAIILAESLIQNEHFDPSHFAYTIGEWQKRIDEGLETGRGAGATISMAARRLYKGTYWKRSGEFSAGNAPAVRVPPLALFHCKNPEDKLLRDAAESAIPTHTDPLAITGTQVFACAIYRLLKISFDDFNAVDFARYLADAAQPLSPQIADAINEIIPHLEARHGEELVFLVPGGAREVTHFDNNTQLEEDIRDLLKIGTGKFIVQSLAASLFCFLSHPYDVENAILTAVNAGGDSDTIAAMTGALSGAFNGAQSIPGRWMTDLEKKDHLIELSNMLYDLATQGHTTKEFGGWRLEM